MALTFTQKSSVDYRRVPPFERILPRECAELVFAGEDGSVLVPIIDGRIRQGHAGTWQRLKQTWDSNGYWHVSLKIANGTGLSVDQFDVQRIVTLAWHGEPIAE